MSVRIRYLLLAVFAFVVPSLAPAQQVSPAQAAPAAGPRVETTATAFRLDQQPADSASLEMQQRRNVGKPVALMVVGGAAILVGAVIGDAPGTLFMIGGAVALLYGLYHYLQ